MKKFIVKPEIQRGTNAAKPEELLNATNEFELRNLFNS